MTPHSLKVSALPVTSGGWFYPYPQGLSTFLATFEPTYRPTQRNSDRRLVGLDARVEGIQSRGEEICSWRLYYR